MIDLARHIEILLLENDCVVIPGFGGFIAHYTPAIWVEEEELFLPPVRKVGFNPQLKMNDGLLVQSYMAAYGTDFSDATRIIQKKVDELIDSLHDKGRVDILHIGEISLSAHNSYVFLPYDNKTVSPLLFGLDSFKMERLKKMQIEQLTKTQTPRPLLQPDTSKKNYEIKINRTFFHSAVAMIAVIMLFFYMSSPVGNTSVEKVNYAQLLPSDFFSRIEKKSLLTTSILVDPLPVCEISKVDEAKYDLIEQTKVAPVAVKEIKISKPAIEKVESPVNDSVNSKREYHIIAASVVKLKDAESIAADYKSKGFTNVGVLCGDGRMRVSLLSFTNREDANNKLLELRKEEVYKNVWLLSWKK